MCLHVGERTGQQAALGTGASARGAHLGKAAEGDADG